MINIAPVAVFAFNRPEHLKNLLDSLGANQHADDTPVVIFLDGPRNDYDRDQQVKILKMLEREFPFKSLEIIVSTENRGLANSIRSGVTKMLIANSRVIVLEDDLLVSPSFLGFMNRGLEIYAECLEVASIHGYQYPIKGNLSEPVFLRGADCWGWATWRDRWALVSFDAHKLISKIMDLNLVEAFNLSGDIDYFGLLQKQAMGEVDSWAICWHASMFLQEKLTLFPPASLVQNTGNDGSGVHSGVNSHFETELGNYDVWEFPMVIEESSDFRNLLGDFFRSSLGKESFFVRITRKLAQTIRSGRL